ncbi:MAG TPA: tetratricopeptide repeat protein [Planctomycetota bacterium]
MNALKTLNKEQWAAAVGIVVGALMLLTGVAGGLSVQSEVPQAGAEIRYEKLPSRYVELPDEKFERYWKKNLGTTSVASRLPIPYLRAPEPREEDLAAPLFRPSPATEAYNKAPAKVKYPVLTPGAPVIPDAQLPPPADVQALVKLAEPEIQSKPDRRGEQERPFAILTHVSGKKYEGKVIADAQGIVRFKDKTGASFNFPKAEVKELLGDDTFEQLYRKESKAIPAGPKGAEARIKLARKLLDWGMTREAREELALAMEAKPDFLDGTLFSVQLMIEASDFEGALAALDAAEESGSADVYYEKGRILRLLGLHEGAVNAFDRAVEISPRHAAARVALARAQLDAGRPGEAEAAANNFIVKMGALQDVAARLKAEAHALRGTAALRAGQIEKAKADAAESLKIDAQGAEAANLLGAALAFDGQWQAAGAEFVKAIRADQYLTDAWTNLATLYLLAGKWADAEALCAAAAQRDPASAQAAGGVGAAQLMAGKKDAAASLDKALSIDPRHLPTLLAQGQMHLALGADDAALGRFREALVADPHSLPAYAGAAAAYLRTARVIAARADAVKMDETRAAPLFKQAGERRVNAETLLRTLKDFDPNRPGAWTALGCAYAGMSRPDDARQALRMAASLLQQGSRPVDPLIYYALGYVEYYFGEGENEEARMDAGLHEFKRGAEATLKDPFSVRVTSECDGVVAAIEEWKVTSVRFEDRFEGEPGKTLGPQWIEVDDKYGVAVTLEKPAAGAGRAKLAGRQSIADFGVTTMSREIPAANFLSFEATLFPEKVEKAEFGMSLYYNETGGSRTGFHVGVDGQGRLRYNAAAQEPRDMDRKDMALGWTEIKTPIPNPAEIRIRITKTEKNRTSFLTISLWDGAKGQWIPAHREIPFNMTQAKNEWRAGLFIRAPKEQDVTLWADNLRVYERVR